jgi:hypothetical protein
MKIKTSIPDESKIANCNICLLSTSMRDCKACAFNVGLLYKSLESIAQITPITSTGPEVRINFIQAIQDHNDTVSTLEV